jgi:hypothetical protein
MVDEMPTTLTTMVARERRKGKLQKTFMRAKEHGVHARLR